MKKKSLQLAMLLTILTSCTSPKVGTQTPGVEVSVQTPLQPTVASPSIGDGGLISEQPCASPCFFGVQIGETKLDQAVSALENNGLYPCYKDVDTVYCDYSVVISTNPATNMVDSIGYEPAVSISIEEIIRKYGSPNLVQVFPGDIPETPRTSLILYWDDIKMRVHLPEIDGFEYPVQDATTLSWITYFDNTSYSDLRNSSFSQPWNGYDIYQQ